MDGPYRRYQLLFCRNDEEGDARIAAFADDAEALEHARRRLLALPEEWNSVVIARTGENEFEYMGAWDRDHEGALRWEDASTA